MVEHDSESGRRALVGKMGGRSRTGRQRETDSLLQETEGLYPSMDDSSMDEWDYTSVISPTLVLVGRTGNGKSATGNSILGRRTFKSKLCSTSVTATSELQSTVLPDGRRIHVVDTPGVFDPDTPIDFIGKEIAKCIDLAKEGVHAVLLVLSTRNRFTVEELAAIDSLQALFGDKIVNYMIVVFTGGDELAENGEDINDYLTENAPASLQVLLKQCGDRRLLFDNKTTDSYKKARQLSELLELVEKVITNNEGQPYSNDMFQEAKVRAEEYAEGEKLKDQPNEDIARLREEMGRVHAEQLKLVTRMIEEKLRAHTEQLESRLEEERLARAIAERCARLAKEKSEADIRSLRKELEKANIEREELRKKYDEHSERQSPCTIL